MAFPPLSYSYSPSRSPPPPPLSLVPWAAQEHWLWSTSDVLCGPEPGQVTQNICCGQPSLSASHFLPRHKRELHILISLPRLTRLGSIDWNWSSMGLPILFFLAPSPDSDLKVDIGLCFTQVAEWHWLVIEPRGHEDDMLTANRSPILQSTLLLLIYSCTYTVS